MISLQKFTFSNSKAVPREIDKADYLYIYLFSYHTTTKKTTTICNEIFIYINPGV